MKNQYVIRYFDNDDEEAQYEVIIASSALRATDIFKNSYWVKHEDDNDMFIDSVYVEI